MFENEECGKRLGKTTATTEKQKVGQKTYDRYNFVCRVTTYVICLVEQQMKSNSYPQKACYVF